VNHEIGTDRARFLRGEITQYSWIGRGSNYLMSDLLAAFLLAQLEAVATVTARRQRIWHAYEAALRPYADKGRLTLPRIPPDCDSSFHFFHFVMPTPGEREALRAFLRERGIGAAVHYTALHRSAGGQRFGVQRAELSNAERIETMHSETTLLHRPHGDRSTAGH
jgi:dTDP-4-amino-4,6-dideoxygalactose transaminase